MTEKLSKEKVDYRRTDSHDRCGICTMFREPQWCTAVLGIIRKEYVCDLFKEKKRAA